MVALKIGRICGELPKWLFPSREWCLWCVLRWCSTIKNLHIVMVLDTPRYWPPCPHPQPNQKKSPWALWVPSLRLIEEELEFRKIIIFPIISPNNKFKTSWKNILLLRGDKHWVYDPTPSLNSRRVGLGCLPTVASSLLSVDRSNWAHRQARPSWSLAGRAGKGQKRRERATATVLTWPLL